MAQAGIKTIQKRLQENLRRVRERIAEACQRAGRQSEEVRLVAVTKSVGVDVIRILIEQGVTELGESRVQQLTQRAAMIREQVKRRRVLEPDRQCRSPNWHMVGHLQRNKVKTVLRWVGTIHGVDSLRLAEDISLEAARSGVAVDAFLQVNVAGEKSKFGIPVGAAGVLAEQIRSLPGLRLIGLMTIAPLAPDAEKVRSCFRRLREIAEDLREQELVTPDFRELSMGMSNDFEVAIEEGASVVRIGSALFDGVVSGVC